ncbi:MAG TPA: peptidyl-prolyl cis-trans isomerase [Pyrinomonadaceae bacterium]|nr:peptidyl-prolyl cis-trans isomerase [Pyrinomonadaceae bacterium]
MLKQLGRLERTRSIIIVGFAVLMAVSLIVFYAPGRNANYLEPTKSTAVVAKVNGAEVTVADVALQREAVRSRYGGQFSLSQLGLTNERILDGVIQRKIIEQEATRLGLAPSQADVAAEIRKQFRDPVTGQYLNVDPDKDQERYRQIAVSQSGDVERFEQQFRDQLAYRNLKAFITSGVTVSDEEVEDKYRRETTTLNLTYVLISPEKLAEKLTVSDDELRAHYEQHKTDYRIDEPQKKVKYLYISQDKAGSKLQISDKDLRERYDQLPAEAKQAGVKVQQILLKVARKDLDAPVEQKAKDLIAKLRGTTPGNTATKEAFAEVARGNSEDPATARNGGFLNRPIKKNPNKPDGLYDRAVDMQPGDISDIPIRYGGNWYILRRDEAVPKSFEEAKPELLATLRNSRSYAVAAKLAERAEGRLKETKDPQQVARELAAEANMQPSEMVKETGYIKPGDDVPDIGSNQQFEQAIAPLNNPNDVGERTGVKGGFAIPIFVDKKDPRIPEFDEVKDKVAQALKQERSKAQLEQKAHEIAGTINNPGEIKAAGEKAGFEVATEDDFKLGVPLGKAGTSPTLDEAIYALREGDVTKTPIKVGDNWVIIGATKRVDADLATFNTQRPGRTTALLTERQNQLFDDYIAKVQERLKQDGKITVYKDVLATLEEDEPVAAPPGQGFPFPTQ